MDITELTEELVSEMAEYGEGNVLELVALALEARAENAATNHRDSRKADILYKAVRAVRAIQVNE